MLAKLIKGINPTDESWTATSRNPERGLGKLYRIKQEAASTERHEAVNPGIVTSKETAVRTVTC